MEHKLKQLIKKAARISLDKKDKDLMRVNLLAFVRKSVSPIADGRQRWVGVLASLLIAVFVGGGVSFASENSLPGDLLYPVKVRVNEEVRAALTVSAEAKADWEARRAERRLEEAAELSSKGEFSVEKREKVESNFKRHVEKVRARIAELETKADLKAAADLSAKMEISLRVHEAILQNFMSSESDAVAAEVATEADNIVKVRSIIEAKISEEEELESAEEMDEDTKVEGKSKIEIKLGL